MANEPSPAAAPEDRMERIVALAKRRGFIFPGSEIYGGLNGFWDYGPLGVELKRNIKDAWWHDVVHCPPTGPDGRPIEMVGLDCAIIMNPKVWEASGHAAGFVDPMVTCKECKRHFRADQIFVIRWMSAEDYAHYQQRVAPYAKYVTGEASVDQMSPEDLAEFTRLAEYAFGKYPAKYVKSVIAQTEKQALVNGQLSTRERKHLGKVFPPTVTPYAKYLERPKAPDFPPPTCPECGMSNSLTDPRQFKLMFGTLVGAMEDSASETYLRPETAQGMFCNFKNVLDTQRVKIPFGIAQIGKAFRNEINPRNYTFRSREFEQMEIEFFCHPDQAGAWYRYWRDARFRWYVDHGLKSDRLRLRDHEPQELAHYAKSCADIEYAFPFGTSELEGVANRTDFDLRQHQQFSGRDMTYFDDETKERFLPHVIEPSGGIDRAALAFLCEAYDEDEAPDEHGKMQKRTVLRFHPRLAPVKVAVFPLVRKDGMPEKARAIYEACRGHMTAFYDEKGAVGRRYRRQDEAGTPFCVTVDGQTREDGTVTVRNRDTMKQERIASDDVAAYVRERLRL